MADQAIINELTYAETLPQWVPTSISFKSRMEFQRALFYLYPSTRPTDINGNYETILAQAVVNAQNGA
jgi:hypothetical protein